MKEPKKTSRFNYTCRVFSRAANFPGLRDTAVSTIEPVVLLIFEKTERMKRVVIEKGMTEQEYIEFELASDLRHEYINRKLLEMPGETLLIMI